MPIDIAQMLGSLSDEEQTAMRDEMGKMPKIEAEYVERAPDWPEQRCRRCSMFKAPEGCTLVAGLINPDGHCRYWEEAR